jgi:glucose/arabinose dehydrogenase
MRRSPALAVTLGLALGATAGAGVAQGAIRMQRLPGAYDKPLLVTSPPGDSRLFIVEQTGRIRVVENGRKLPRPFLDLSSGVSGGNEQGLLGLAFHPKFAQNGLFYVDYTDRAGDTRVVEYHATGNRADAGSRRQLLFVNQPFANHNGGNLVFGPDSKLYIGLGDGGSGEDPLNSGQRRDTLLGKILRIDVDARTGGKAYGIPPDNPYASGAEGLPEIWYWGLRNPWRFSFDRARGDMWIGDVGQNRVEEVDFRQAGSAGGANFGWRAFEGRLPGFGAAAGPTVPPVFTYTHARGCSVTGGFVYRGPGLASLKGRYIFADYCSGRAWTLRAGPSPGGAREITGRIPRSLATITSFGEDSRGRLYATVGRFVYRFTGT